MAAGDSSSGVTAPDQAARSVDAAARLIDLVVAATASSSSRPQSSAQATSAETQPEPLEQLGRFLQGESWADTLSTWLGSDIPRQKSDLLRLLGRAIALIDSAVTDQVNAILHHPRFQKLEASWRGVRYVVSQLEDDRNGKIRMLSASWQDLANDQRKATEFDRSELFRKVYSGEFGIAGGEPFGVLIGDYEGYVHLLDRDTGKTRSRLATDGSQVVTIALLGETALVATKGGGLFAIKAE